MFAKILLITWITLIAVGMLSMYILPSTQPTSKDKEAALEDCLKAVQNKCASVIEYAVMLEKENAKLNRRLKEARRECTVTP